jgi:hypothetical protein
MSEITAKLGYKVISGSTEGSVLLLQDDIARRIAKTIPKHFNFFII